MFISLSSRRTQKIYPHHVASPLIYWWYCYLWAANNKKKALKNFTQLSLWRFKPGKEQNKKQYKAVNEPFLKKKKKKEKKLYRMFWQLRSISLNNRGTKDEPGVSFFHHVALSPVSTFGITNRHVLSSVSCQSLEKKNETENKRQLYKMSWQLGLISLINRGTENKPERFFFITLRWILNHFAARISQNSTCLA